MDSNTIANDIPKIKKKIYIDFMKFLLLAITWIFLISYNSENPKIFIANLFIYELGYFHELLGIRKFNQKIELRGPISDKFIIIEAIFICLTILFLVNIIQVDIKTYLFNINFGKYKYTPDLINYNWLVFSSLMWPAFSMFTTGFERR